MLQVLLCFSLLAGNVTVIFIFYFACDWQVNVTGIFFMFQFAHNSFYTVIFMFHLPYIDVYFNLPISKIIHMVYIYIQIKD